MNRLELVKSINAEIAKMQKAVALLSDAPQTSYVKGKKGSTGKTFIMNASARKKISDAQKDRWKKVHDKKAAEERAASAKYKEGLSSAKAKNRAKK